MNFEHDDFEYELRAALRREPAPPGFAANVLSKTRAVAVPVRRRFAAWAVAAVLTAAAVLPTAIVEYRHRQEARALEARRELVVALTITRAKLRQARERIQRNTRHAL